MATFLHLSDLHFTTTDAGTQFDRDTRIRAAILDDLGKDGRTNFDAILISGDIAYHGQAEEFVRAGKWFEEVRTKVNVPVEAVYVIPGNHDINQVHVAQTSMLFDAHERIRGFQDVNQRDENLQKKLQDTSYDFLLPLTEFCNFAAERGCPTSTQKLAWVSQLETRLNDGTSVRLHGLNSALISDEGDRRSNLLVGPYQLNHLAVQNDCVNVVMCHHPSSWLIDGNEVDDVFRRHAQIVLTGHEHNSRCFQQGSGLRICAGAVHPSRGEGEWQPSYNVIHLTVENSTRRTLITRVETRYWHKTDLVFVRYFYSGNDGLHEHRQDLPARVVAQDRVALDNGQAVITSPTVLIPVSAPDNELNLAFAASRRRLIVHFFRLGVITRYNVADSLDIWDESDESFQGQAKWTRVFDRAEKADKFHELWNAIAKSDQSLIGQPNPFNKK